MWRVEMENSIMRGQTNWLIAVINLVLVENTIKGKLQK